jgi:hypothetical protein
MRVVKDHSRRVGFANDHAKRVGYAAEGTKRVGIAKRIRVQMPLGARHEAWDCRPFGLGRIIAPALPTRVEIAQGTWLDLASGEVVARHSVTAA